MTRWKWRAGAAGIVALTTIVGACAAAPRQRPVKMGPVDTGAGSIEAVRRQLEGTWALVSLEMLSASGTMAPLGASATLTYDAYGNLTIAANSKPGEAGPIGAVNFSGHAEIDPKAQRLLLRSSEAGAAAVSQAMPAVSTANVRYYELNADQLKLTTKDASNQTTAVTVWRKVR